MYKYLTGFLKFANLGENPLNILKARIKPKLILSSQELSY